MKLKLLMRTAMARPKSAFRSSDVARAVKGATAGGLLVASVLITPDGSIQVNTTLGLASGNTTTTAAGRGHLTAAPAEPDEDEDALLRKLEGMKSKGKPT